MKKSIKEIDKVLIDGDVLLYEAAFPSSTIVNWGDDIWSYAGDARLCEQMFWNLMDGILMDIWGEVNRDRVWVAFTGPGDSFRKQSYPNYKFSRRTDRKPPQYSAVRKELSEDKDMFYSEPTLEADDLLGIWTTRNPGGVCVSIDKDMKTIPGWHYDYTKGAQGLVFVSDEEASTTFFRQVLTGDRVDDYPGCAGIGPVKAERIVKLGEDPKTQWKKVVQTYEAAGFSEEFAISQARCAYILQDKNFKDGKVIQWDPKAL